MGAGDAAVCSEAADVAAEAVAGTLATAPAVVTDAFNANNAESVASMFAPEALFWGTVSRDLIATPAGVRQYFDTAFAGPPSKGAKVSALGPASIVVTGENVAILSGLWKIENTVDGKPFAGENRISLTLVKRGDRWLITSFHNSRRP